MLHETFLESEILKEDLAHASFGAEAGMARAVTPSR
jgi:hypothetical protein